MVFYINKAQYYLETEVSLPGKGFFFSDKIPFPVRVKAKWRTFFLYKTITYFFLNYFAYRRIFLITNKSVWTIDENYTSDLLKVLKVIYTSDLLKVVEHCLKSVSANEANWIALICAVSYREFKSSTHWRDGFYR